MRDIRDENSPYHDRYTELDYWCYANALTDEQFDDSELWRKGPDPNKEVFFAQVNPNGYMVPLLESTRQELEQTYGIAEPSGETCTVNYFSYGELPEKLAKIYYGMQAEIIAPHVETVPGWLAKDPPIAAVITPEGIAMLGTPGDGVGRYNQRWREDDPESWALFDNYGDLQHLGQWAEPWHALFFDGYSDLVCNAEASERSGAFEFGQYVIIYRFGEDWNQTQTEIYNYNGDKVDVDMDELYTSGSTMQPIAGEMLRLVYAVQHRELDIQN